MQITVNGTLHEINDDQGSMLLLDYLREVLDLTGTKNGCKVGICGACVVLVDGKPMRSCRRTLKQTEGKTILTVEGLEDKTGKLHPLQKAFVDHAAIQCGYCIPGMLMTSHALLMANAHPTRDEIRKAINNNLCRCTGYKQIVDAIEAAAPAYENQP